MTNGIKNKIVTSVYDLKYVTERGNGMYKGFDLLIKTIRNIIFDGYEYVIYTDQATMTKYNLASVFPQSNVTIKINELNGSFYTEVISPLKEKKVSEGHIWDRIHCVNNYVEVMYNKFDYLLRESENFDGNVMWIDAGLFGTSCGQAWRNYIGEIAHTKLFVDKIFEKISSHGFISLKGNSIVMNYEEREKISKLFDISCFIVPGGLFGGKSILVKEYFSDYQNTIRKMVDMGFYTSDQEVLCVSLSKRDQMMFFEHNDWDDLQRGILKIMDLYDETKYNTNERYDVQPVVKPSLPDRRKRTDREILEEILKLTPSFLDGLDLSKFDSTLQQMTSFAWYFKDPAGSNHYRLLSYISDLLNEELILDIGADNGCSGLALTNNESVQVHSYDIVLRHEIQLIKRPNFQFFIENILQTAPEKISQVRFMMLDTFHDGKFEAEFYAFLKSVGYKGLLFLDDIHLNPAMEQFWASITEEKHDLTRIGHSTGSGIVIFE